MWRRLMDKHPLVFEAFNWGTLALALGAFLLALAHLVV